MDQSQKWLHQSNETRRYRIKLQHPVKHVLVMYIGEHKSVDVGPPEPVMILTNKRFEKGTDKVPFSCIPVSLAERTKVGKNRFITKQ
jgi:hypothetical protein